MLSHYKIIYCRAATKEEQDIFQCERDRRSTQILKETDEQSKGQIGNTHSWFKGRQEALSLTMFLFNHQVDYMQMFETLQTKRLSGDGCISSMFKKFILKTSLFEGLNTPTEKPFVTKWHIVTVAVRQVLSMKPGQT